MIWKLVLFVAIFAAGWLSAKHSAWLMLKLKSAWTKLLVALKIRKVAGQ